MKALTKEELISLGVTDVKEDGTVYVNGELKTISVIVGKHKYGQDRKYLSVALTDRSQKVKPKHFHVMADGKKNYNEPWYWTYKIRQVPLARLMLAWFYGEVPANMDADHIDGNPMNNNLSNLQMLTRKENLAKRLLTQEQIAKAYREVEKKLKKENK